jgi:pre-mRNA-splicing factor ATP-dependent RNA helicase DHX16
VSSRKQLPIFAYR